MLQFIVEGAAIYDGEGGPPIHTDVALAGDRVALIGDLREREAAERIDGRGLALAPGFIDVHAHTDELWLVNPHCEGKVRQGVTTEIGGNCGASVAPLRGEAQRRKAADMRSYGDELEWQNLDEFFTLVERGGIALNVATLVGLGTTRRSVRGDLEGPLTSLERSEQERLVHDAVEQGAIGVSSGLIYVPSRYADIEELAGCARVARDAGGPCYASHIRSESDALLEAIDEGLEVGRRAGVHVQFSHHKAAYKRNWGKVNASLERIERARGEGLSVATDVYPYIAMWTDLDTILPADALFGGRAAAIARLRDPQMQTALALRLELDWAQSWGDIQISTVASERNSAFTGWRLDALARHWGTPPARAALRLLTEEELEVQAVFFAMSEDDVATVLSASFTSIGSDASARAISGPTARGIPHPRTFGCFPRVFGRFVRGRGTLEMAEAIRRMTLLPADTFGFAGRGRIALGAFADLVLFDPKRIVDRATYDAPYAYSDGIDTVFVNGEPVVRRGESTRALPGRVLRAGRASV